MFAKDKAILRKLATQYAEIAALPIQQETKRQWYALHRLKPERPMFMIDELPWNEMNVDDELTLQCENMFYKEIEMNLRRQLYRWKHFRDDFVYEPIIYIPKIINGVIIPKNSAGIYEVSGAIPDLGIKINEETRSFEKENMVQAHLYADQIQTEEDLQKITAPDIYLDIEETNERAEMAHDALDGILDVCMDGYTPYFSPWDYIVMWRGLERVIYDMVDRPEFMHKTINHVTNVYLDMLNQLEEKGLLGHPQQQVHCTGAWTDLLPAEGYNPEKPRTIDLWTFGMAQMLYLVSPEEHNEFEFEYAKKWYGRFGLGYYGCCEPLDDRMDFVKTIPNIRKISVSAWVKNYERMAEKMEGKYVFSCKPSPADLLSTAWNPEKIRKDLCGLLAVAVKYNCPCEFTLKDISTVNHHPERVWEWADIMRNIVQG
ncbi:MAG: hypothetical protein ACOX7R_07165 [Acetivibrionales bacterium]